MYVPRVGPLDEVERELCERARGVCVLCCLRLSSRLRECSLSRAGWFPCSCLEKDLSTCKFGTQTYKHHLSRLSRSVVTAPATANVLRRSFGSVRARAACVALCRGSRSRVRTASGPVQAHHASRNAAGACACGAAEAGAFDTPSSGAGTNEVRGDGLSLLRARAISRGGPAGATGARSSPRGMHLF